MIGICVFMKMRYPVPGRAKSKQTAISQCHEDLVD